MFGKLLFNKGIVTPSLITIAAAVLFFRASTADHLYIRLYETFFQTALVCLLLGFCCIVRNGGLFKSLSYISYRKYKREMKNQKKYKTIPATERENDFAQFISNKYSQKWNGVPYFIFCGVFALLYVLFYLFS